MTELECICEQIRVETIESRGYSSSGRCYEISTILVSVAVRDVWNVCDGILVEERTFVRIRQFVLRNYFTYDGTSR